MRSLEKDLEQKVRFVNVQEFFSGDHNLIICVQEQEKKQLTQIAEELMKELRTSDEWSTPTVYHTHNVTVQQYLMLSLGAQGAVY